MATLDLYKDKKTGKTYKAWATAEDLNPAVSAFNAMKRLQPYLYAIEYSELDYEAAREYFATHFVPVQGACTALRKGNQLGRNYDWTYDKQVEFLIRTKAHNGRYASIGIAGSISALTTDTIGEYSEEFKWLPFRMLDGMNEKGLTANVNMLNHDEQRSLPVEGTTPHIEERESICSIMLVRYVLDNFATPQEACEYIRNYVRVYPPYHDGKTTDLHFALCNKEQTYYLAFEPERVGGRTVHRAVFEPATETIIAMTNFRLARVDSEATSFDRTDTTNGIEKYGSGLERWNLCYTFGHDTTTERTLLDFMSNDLKWTNCYNEQETPWETEFVDDINDIPRWDDEGRLGQAQEAAITAYNVTYPTDEARRAFGKLWHTVHTVVYDLNELTLQLVTQEGNTEDALTIDCFKSLPASKGDLGNIDFSNVAKEQTLQGVSDKVGTFTNPTETVAHKLENLTFDKTDLAKEATTAKQGSNPNVSLTSLDGKLGNVVMGTDSEFEQSLEYINSQLV